MHEKSEEYRHLSEKERALQRELEAMRNEKVTFFLKCLHTHLIYINFCSLYMEIYVHIMFFDKIFEKSCSYYEGQRNQWLLIFMFSTLGK